MNRYRTMAAVAMLSAFINVPTVAFGPERAYDEKRRNEEAARDRAMGSARIERAKAKRERKNAKRRGGR